jgi:hypothetical protein
MPKTDWPDYAENARPSRHHPLARLRRKRSGLITVEGDRQAKPQGVGNHRNGKSAKTVLTDTGTLRIDVPRDREGSFEPQIVGKHERRFTGFDDT